MLSEKGFAKMSISEAPKIITEEIPGPKTKNLIDLSRSLESPSLVAPYILPVAWKEAKGATIKDLDGNIYIDLMAGVAVVSVGHCNPEVVKSIKKQAERLIHAVDIPHPLRIDLIKKLIEIAPGALKNNSRTLYGSSGAEAVEFAIKLAKWYTKMHGIIAFEGAFHGRSAGALALTSRKEYQEGFTPLMPAVYRMPYPYCYRCPFGKEYPECDMQCVRFIERALENPESGVTEPAALIIEPIQGEGGYIVPPEGYFQKIKKICKAHDILFIDDEIQTGFARTGRMFAIEHWNVTPDIMTVAKGIADGFPISAVIAKKEIFETLSPCQHTSTFGGNPLGCAAALATIDFLEKNKISERSSKLGDYFMKNLRDLAEGTKIIGDVRGKGLMIGIEFVKNKETKEPLKDDFIFPMLVKMIKRGIMPLVCGSWHQVVRMMPPLVITKTQIDKSIEIFGDVVKESEKNL